MEEKNSKQENISDLRKRAEEMHKLAQIPLDNLTDADVRKLAHELQVHQIELEMQNEDLRRAQILIENARSEYRDLFDFAPVGYLTFNIDQQIVKANQTIARMLGEEKRNLNNKTFYLHIIRQDSDILYLHHQKVFESKEYDRCELRFKRKDGVLFYAQLDSSYVMDSEGNGFCRTSIIDITDRKESENKMQMYKLIIDNVSDLAFVAGSKGDILYVNQVFEELSGRKVEEFVGASFAPLFDDENLIKANRLYERTLQGESLKSEIYFKDTGKLCEHKTFPLRDVNGVVIGVFGLSRDITDRKLAEEAVLHAKERKFRDLVGMIPDIVYKIDSEGRFTYINSSVDVLGYESNELLGKHFSILFDEKDVESISRNTILEKVQGGITDINMTPKLFDERRTGERMTRNLEICLVKKSDKRYKNLDQRRFIGLVTAFGDVEVVSDYRDVEDGKHIQPTGTIGIIRDITERIKLQEKAIQVGQLAEIGSLAASVAHQLNSPINCIMVCGELLQERFDNNDKDFDMVRRIISEAERVSTVIKTLLSFSRDKDDEMDYININELLDEAISLVKWEMEKDGIRLVSCLDKDVPNIFLYPQRIQQTFINIINNSIYALNKEDQRKHKEKMIRITSKKLLVNDLAYIEIVFYDNGCGIPADKIDNIMEQFFTTKPRGSGTGLGLSISKRIINEHSGSIEINSLEKEYTNVIITLPTINEECQ